MEIEAQIEKLKTIVYAVKDIDKYARWEHEELNGFPSELKKFRIEKEKYQAELKELEANFDFSVNNISSILFYLIITNEALILRVSVAKTAFIDEHYRAMIAYLLNKQQS